MIMVEPFDRERAHRHARNGADQIRANQGLPRCTDEEWERAVGSAARMTAKIIQEAQEKAHKAAKIHPGILAASFDFARRQRDPKFRAYLAAIGWTADQNVAIALDDEPVTSVVSRMVANDTPMPALVAIPYEREPFGFRFLFMWKVAVG